MCFLFFYLFRDEKELLSGFPQMYQKKLQEEGSQDVLHIKKFKQEPYRVLVDQTYSQFKETLVTNQDPHGQIENDETTEAEYPNESG